MTLPSHLERTGSIVREQVSPPWMESCCCPGRERCKRRVARVLIRKHALLADKALALRVQLP